MNRFKTHDFGDPITFPTLEAQNIEFRGEFLNVFNHSQFGTPDTGLGDPTFGVITTTYENRQIQVALKYIF